MKEKTPHELELARDRNRKWRAKGGIALKEKEREYHQKRRALNHEHLLSLERCYREKNRDQIRARQRHWSQSNKDKAKATRQKWALANPEKNAQVKLESGRRCASTRKKWRDNNRDRWRENHRNNMRRRRNTDSTFKLLCNLRTRIGYALKGKHAHKSSRTPALLGCSIPDFMLYLESRFLPGMTWSNYGSHWHVDHIIPCALFDMSKSEHQRACFHFSNLQPLSAVENQIKSDSCTEEQRLFVKSL